VIYTPYAGAAGMLLHMNRKFTMGKLQVIEINCFYSIEKDNVKTN
jgi:hypothetical protein